MKKSLTEWPKKDQTARRVLLRLLIGLGITIVLCGAGFLGLDLKLSALVAGLLSKAPSLSQSVSHLPDFLLPFTVAVVLFSWSTHFVLRRSGGPEPWTSLTMRMGLSVSLGFSAKAILKVVFGRVNTRVWLLTPHLYGFHWFHGGGDFNGFPSGHMAVFTPIAVALGWAFPRLRWLSITGLGLLALALLVTDYHFLSDVAAGTYLGILADEFAAWAVGMALFRRG